MPTTHLPGKWCEVSNPDLDASLAERLGGRWAISWQAFAITILPGIGVLALSAQASDDALTWFVIATAAVTMASAWTYLMHRTVFRNRAVQPIALSWVILAAVIAGLLYVGTAIVLGSLLHVLDPDSVVSQFSSLFVVIVSWGLLVTLVLDSQWRYRVQRERLIEQAIQQQLAVAQELDVLREVRDAVNSEISQQVKASSIELIRKIDELVEVSEASMGALAQDLRDSADKTVRPLSHKLEVQARRRHRTPGFFTALANIVRYQPFRPLAASIVYVVTATPREVTLHGWSVGLALLAITVAFLFGIMTPMNQAMGRWPEHHASIYLVGLALIQVPTVLLAPIYGDVTVQELTPGSLVVTSAFGTIVVLATSAFGSWNRTRREVIADFRREVDEETIATLARGEALAKATREAAIMLHGSVQTQLHACALTIEAAMNNGDLVEVNRALVHARALLEQPNLSLQDRSVTSLQDAIDERIAQWRGLLSVSVSMDTDVEALSGLLAGHIADVVEEGIANAIHHGSATAVAVDIALQENTIHIRIGDDGTGPGVGSPGLGSQLMGGFDATWSLTPAHPGSLLQVHIPQPSALLQEPNPATP